MLSSKFVLLVLNMLLLFDLVADWLRVKGKLYAKIDVFSSISFFIMKFLFFLKVEDLDD